MADWEIIRGNDSASAYQQQDMPDISQLGSSGGPRGANYVFGNRYPRPITDQTGKIVAYPPQTNREGHIIGSPNYTPVDPSNPFWKTDAGKVLLTTPHIGSNVSAPFVVQEKQPEDRPGETVAKVRPYQEVGPAGLALPPEADILYGRVRQAEGTAGGSGYVLYGGIPFTPGADHPGHYGGRGRDGRPTSAAGPGQWEYGTWEGLKPEFRQKFGRDPDFSSEADQKAMTWLNATKVYPGGEAKLEADLKAGKLDTAALAGQWAGFKGGGGWQVTSGGGNTRISDTALAEAQKHGKTAFMADPNAILALLPDVKEGEGGERKRSSLEKSLGKGEAIQDLPEITGEMQPDGSLKLTSYDGRHRLEKLAEAGYTKIPVVVQGVKGSPSSVVGMSGVTLPFAQNFLPTPEQQAAATQAHSLADRLAAGYASSAAYGGGGADQIGPDTNTLPLFAGAARTPVGAAQLATHGAAALGVPGAQTAAGMADRAAQGMEDYIAAQPGGPEMAAVGDIAATLALPELRGANALARVARPIATGALIGATQPVTNVPQQGYFPQVGVNTLLGAATGTVPLGVNALRWARSHIVTPGDVTRAVSRLVGEDTSKLTPSKLQGVKTRLQNTMERIENSHDLDLTKDTTGLHDKVRQIRLQGSQLGPEGNQVVAAVNEVMDRFLRHDTVIPGKEAAAFWRTGSPIDRLTQSNDANIRMLGNDLERALRNAFSAQLPEDAAREYSAARSAWRDYRMTTAAVRGGQVQPGTFMTQVGRKSRFPNFRGETTGPPVTNVARALDEIYGPDRSLASQILRRGAADIVGGAIGHVAGLPFGPIGAWGGSAAGAMAADRLAQMRFARGNALATLRRSAPVPATLNMLSRIGAAVPNVLGPLTAPAATALTMPGATF